MTAPRPVQRCEMPSCDSKGKHAAVGRYQVYDPDFNVATMTRPAHMCAACVQFACECGMTIKEEANG